jgi:hypothetical protein
MLAVGAGVPGPPCTWAIATSNNSTVKMVAVVKKKFLVMLNPQLSLLALSKPPP